MVLKTARKNKKIGTVVCLVCEHTSAQIQLDNLIF